MLLISKLSTAEDAMQVEGLELCAAFACCWDIARADVWKLCWVVVHR